MAGARYFRSVAASDASIVAKSHRYRAHLSLATVLTHSGASTLDGHKAYNPSALTRGKLVQIRQVRMSDDLSRAAGGTVLPNADRLEDCLSVNFWYRFNVHGVQRRNGVWYVQRPL